MRNGVMKVGRPLWKRDTRVAKTRRGVQMEKSDRCEMNGVGSMQRLEFRAQEKGYPKSRGLSYAGSARHNTTAFSELESFQA